MRDFLYTVIIMTIQLTTTNIGGDIVKDDDTYTLSDNKTLNHLVLSQTKLHPNKSTRGHHHVGQEEIYFFIEGEGDMIVGTPMDKPFRVKAGSVILIPDGAFHKVINTTENELVFDCVFEGRRNH